MMKLALILVLSAHSGLALVRTWVSPTGVDTNACTREAPCRTFQAAIAAVNIGGEVVALESAGYGAFTIDRSVAILAPLGVHAAIAPTVDAITINAGDNGEVMLKNLFLRSTGGQWGIVANSVANLTIENCYIHGFDFFGIDFRPTTVGARLHVVDSLIRWSEFAVSITSPGARAVLDSVQMTSLLSGVRAQQARVVVRNCLALGGLNGGYWSDQSSRMVVESSQASYHAIGFLVGGGATMTMTRCTATSNGTGVYADSSFANIYVARSVIARNGIGVGAATDSNTHTRQDNIVRENDVPGAFKMTFLSY